MHLIAEPQSHIREQVSRPCTSTHFSSAHSVFGLLDHATPVQSDALSFDS